MKQERRDRESRTSWLFLGCFPQTSWCCCPGKVLTFKIPAQESDVHISSWFLCRNHSFFFFQRKLEIPLIFPRNFSFFSAWGTWMNIKKYRIMLEWMKLGFYNFIFLCVFLHFSLLLLPSHPDPNPKWKQDRTMNSLWSQWDKHSPTLQEISGNFSQFLQREVEIPTPAQTKNS